MMRVIHLRKYLLFKAFLPAHAEKHFTFIVIILSLRLYSIVSETSNIGVIMAWRLNMESIIQTLKCVKSFILNV